MSKCTAVLDSAKIAKIQVKVKKVSPKKTKKERG